MKRLRLWTVVLGLWFVFFFNIERILRAAANEGSLLNTEVNLIQTYTYAFAALSFVLILLLPRLGLLGFSGLMTAFVSLFLVLWYNLAQWNNYSITSGGQIATLTVLTIIQVSAILITGLLARQVNSALREFEGVIADITFNHIGARPKPFYESQGNMYRELKRARYYQRPLSVIALEIDNATFEVNAPTIVSDLQQAMIKEFVMAKMARIMDSKLYDFNSIAIKDNNFIITLPETDKDTAMATIVRLKEALATEMNLNPKIGTASFPENAVTFERLIEHALTDIQKGDKQLTPTPLADTDVIDQTTQTSNEPQLMYD